MTDKDYKEIWLRWLLKYIVDVQYVLEGIKEIFWSMILRDLGMVMIAGLLGMVWPLIYRIMKWEGGVYAENYMLLDVIEIVGHMLMFARKSKGVMTWEWTDNITNISSMT